MEKKKETHPGLPSHFRFWKRFIFFLIIAIVIFFVFRMNVRFTKHAMTPSPPGAGITSDNSRFPYTVPLDPESPWPKFRCNALQNGRSPVVPEQTNAKSWTIKTAKGIFSSPVVDQDGTVYIGSADQHFYAVTESGKLKWKVHTGEIIDSSALLDDGGKVYVGSGDAHVYALERETGSILWKFKAHTPQEVTEQYGVKTYNLNWFEGNMAMLPDGRILAPNDNYLIYHLDRSTGEPTGRFIINEMGWSLPAVNAKTGRVFTGSNFMAIKNVYCFDIASGRAV